MGWGRKGPWQGPVPKKNWGDLGKPTYFKTYLVKTSIKYFILPEPHFFRNYDFKDCDNFVRPARSYSP